MHFLRFSICKKIFRRTKEPASEHDNIYVLYTKISSHLKLPRDCNKSVNLLAKLNPAISKYITLLANKIPTRQMLVKLNVATCHVGQMMLSNNKVLYVK